MLDRLRLAGPADVPALARLYAQCAQALGPSVYTREQVQAWASFGTDSPAFAEYVLGAETWVACDEQGGLLGFSGCDADGEVRELYVRPDVSRRGVGARLLAHVVRRAGERGLPRLAAWVTPLSRPLFLREGFMLVQTVQAPYQGVLFERYRVERG